MKNIIKTIIKYKLAILSKLYSWRVKPQIIVITGTINRLTFKKVFEGGLEPGKDLRVGADKHNAELGVPLSILGLSIVKKEKWPAIIFQAVYQAFFGKKIKFILLELAIDKPNDMDYLLKIFKPYIVVIAGIEPSYMENFKTLDNIALEYKKLVEKIYSDGLVVLNADDERVVNLKNYSKAKVLTFGINNKADYQALNMTKKDDETKFIVNNQTIKLDKFGKHHILAKLALLAVNNFNTK